ncbi:hypothetical protein MAR_035269, partial [Mya arenaria]
MYWKDNKTSGLVKKTRKMGTQGNYTNCTVINEEGDSEQIEMKTYNFTGLSNKGTIVSLSREPCASNSTIQLTILPQDIK